MGLISRTLCSALQMQTKFKERGEVTMDLTFYFPLTTTPPPLRWGLSEVIWL